MKDPLHEAIAWLSTLTVTKPFTLDDAATIKNVLKTALPKATVDVHCPRGVEVFVTVDFRNTRYTRTFDVT